MKKILVCLWAVMSFSVMAQDSENAEDFKRNEFKFNALGLVLGSFEVSYERLLNEESALGISTSFAVLDEWDIRFALMPYYRHYFGKKPAQGFFAEGFGMLNTVRDSVYDYNNSDYYNYERKTITDFAFGVGVGGKWVSKKGVIFEINGGVGRNLFSNEYNRDFRFIGRIGLTAGYRF